jgi:heme/copper-type cytochrome/quinol oxidase subunit 3
VTELARHETHYSVVEREPPEVMGRALRVGGHLWSSATAFFFIAFLFAYFYLRSLNNNGMWHPHRVKAPTTLGTLIAAAVVASAVVVVIGTRRLRAGDDRAFRLASVAGLALGLLAAVLQIAEYATIGFGPTDGGFASVFLGWTGLYLLFVIASLYWLETLVATSFRYRGASSHQPGEASGDRGRTGDDIAQPVSLVDSGAEAFSSYWSVLAGIGALTWVILYLL